MYIHWCSLLKTDIYGNFPFWRQFNYKDKLTPSFLIGNKKLNQLVLCFPCWHHWFSLVFLWEPYIIHCYTTLATHILYLCSLLHCCFQTNSIDSFYTFNVIPWCYFLFKITIHMPSVTWSIISKAVVITGWTEIILKWPLEKRNWWGYYFLKYFGVPFII